MKVLIFFLLLGLMACQPTNTRGACRDFEVCETSETRECHPLRIWFECNPGVEEKCEWQEFGTNWSVSNDGAVPCEECDPAQCPSY